MFKLEAVERVRKLRRDEQRRALAEAIRAVREADARLERLSADRSAAADSARRERVGARLNVPSLVAQQMFRSQLDERIAAARGQRTKLEQVVDVERKKLAEVTKQLKVIEKLREKQWARHLADVGRREQREMDEQALRAFAPGASETGAFALQTMG